MEASSHELQAGSGRAGLNPLQAWEIGLRLWAVYELKPLRIPKLRLATAGTLIRGIRLRAGLPIGPRFILPCFRTGAGDRRCHGSMGPQAMRFLSRSTTYQQDYSLQEANKAGAALAGCTPSQDFYQYPVNVWRGCTAHHRLILQVLINV